MAWYCRRYRALPEAGGIYDQPARLLRSMTIAANVYDLIEEFNHLKPGTAAEWANRHPQAWAAVARIMGWQRKND